MTKLHRPLSRAVESPLIRAKLRRPLIVTLTPEGQLELRPKRIRAEAARVTLDLFTLYFRGLTTRV